MRKVLRALLPLLAALALVPVAASASVTASTPRPNPTPTPSPTPPPAIFLSPNSAAPDQHINLSGSGFPANFGLNVLFDGTQISTVQTDATGSIPSTSLVVPDNAAGPSHSICVEYQGINVCAAFSLLAAATPTPSPSPSASPSPSPSASVAPIPTGSTGAISPLALLTRPPFVFLPVLAVGGLLLFLAIWAWRIRPGPPLGDVTVQHLAPAPRAYEAAPPLQPEPPAAPPEPEPIRYESPQAAPPPPAPPPAAPPSGADIPPDLPEATE